METYLQGKGYNKPDRPRRSDQQLRPRVFKWIQRRFENGLVVVREVRRRREMKPRTGKEWNNLWEKRLLDAIEPDIELEEKQHAQNPRRPETPAVVQMPTVRRHSPIVSAETEPDLVPIMRLCNESILESPQDKGGKRRQRNMIEPTLGILVIQLIKLKEICLEHARGTRKQADSYTDVVASSIACGESIAYNLVALRLDQLIESVSANTPKGT